MTRKISEWGIWQLLTRQNETKYWQPFGIYLNFTEHAVYVNKDEEWCRKTEDNVLWIKTSLWNGRIKRTREICIKYHILCLQYIWNPYLSIFIKVNGLYMTVIVRWKSWKIWLSIHLLYYLSSQVCVVCRLLSAEGSMLSVFTNRQEERKRYKI